MKFILGLVFISFIANIEGFMDFSGFPQYFQFKELIKNAPMVTNYKNDATNLLNVLQDPESDSNDIGLILNDSFYQNVSNAQDLASDLNQLIESQSATRKLNGLTDVIKQLRYFSAAISMYAPVWNYDPNKPYTLLELWNAVLNGDEHKSSKIEDQVINFPCPEMRNLQKMPKISENVNCTVNPLLFTYYDRETVVDVLNRSLDSASMISLQACTLLYCYVNMTSEQTTNTASQVKKALSQAIVLGFDQGWLHPNGTLKNSTNKILPNGGLGVDGAGSITNQQSLNMDGGIPVIGSLLPLTAIQHDKRPNEDMLKESVSFIRPVTLPSTSRPASTTGNIFAQLFPYPNQTPECAVGTGRCYGATDSGYIDKYLIEQNNPYNMTLQDFFNSPHVAGVLSQGVTRPFGGLTSKQISNFKWTMYFNFKGSNANETANLWKNFKCNTQYLGVNRSSTQDEIDFNNAVLNYFGIQFQSQAFGWGLVGGMPYPVIVDLWSLVSGLRTVPLLCDPNEGNIDGPAFVCRTKIETMHALNMNAAAKGYVRNTQRWVSQEAVSHGNQLAWSGRDGNLSAERNRQYALWGGLVPANGTISSCILPLECNLGDGATDQFSLACTKNEMAITYHTSFFAQKKNINQKLSPVGSDFVDAGCKSSQLILNRWKLLSGQ